MFCFLFHLKMSLYYQYTKNSVIFQIYSEGFAAYPPSPASQVSGTCFAEIVRFVWLGDDSKYSPGISSYKAENRRSSSRNNNWAPFQTPLPPRCLYAFRS